MRIGWATPFNVRSSIGKFSLILCEELQARGYDMEIIRIESGEDLAFEQLACDLPVVNAAACAVDEYDVLIVNFGNHAPYHAQLVSLLAKRAPLGIFHDIEMRDFEWGLMRQHGLHIPRLIEIEPEVATEPLADMVDPAARPLLATLAAMCCGAVIHAPHYHATISAYCPGAVKIIPLCIRNTASAGTAPPPAPGLRVTIFGVINENKQPGRVLEALALLRPHFGPVEFHLAGAAEDGFRDHLMRQAEALGLEPPIFHGYVSDDELIQIIDNSHAVCCLRYPVSEGGSGSLLTALFRARPLIVSNIASYATVPGDLVYKVSYGGNPQDLSEALMDIFVNSEEAEEKARRGVDWVSIHSSPASYVDALEPLLGDIGNDVSLAKVARDLVPAVTTPSHEPMQVAVEAFAEVLDWMDASQK